MTTAPTPTYLKARELHREIESLYPEVERHRAWFRNMSFVGKNVPLPTGTIPIVDLDRVYCALAIKAATTKRAVLSLCESGDGDSAYTLSRVILENGVLMRWMLDGPGRDRLETYVLFMSVLHEKTIALVNEHFKDRPEMLEIAKDKSDPYHVAIAEAVFDGNDNTWAYFPSGRPGRLRKIPIAEMFKGAGDQGPAADQGGATRTFGYDGPYSMASQFIHSGPESLYGILRNLTPRHFFALSPQPCRERCGMALSDSNIAMLIALDALSDYMGLGLERRITKMKDAWHAFARSTFDADVDEAASPKIHGDGPANV
jgi:hypothetical protein